MQAVTERGLPLDHTYTDLKIVLGLSWCDVQPVPGLHCALAELCC